jgi:LDH2 family malate/lactate/ureidoglycolate dehydrogenase
MKSIVVVPAEALRDTGENILISAGAPAPKAKLMAEAMVGANLRGVDSHGVLLVPAYVKQLSARNIDPDSDGHVITESGACLLYERIRALAQE